MVLRCSISSRALGISSNSSSRLDRGMDPPATDQLEDLGVGFLTVAATRPIEAQGPANAEGVFT